MPNNPDESPLFKLKHKLSYIFINFSGKQDLISLVMLLLQEMNLGLRMFRYIAKTRRLVFLRASPCTESQVRVQTTSVCCKRHNDFMFVYLCVCVFETPSALTVAPPTWPAEAVIGAAWWCVSVCLMKHYILWGVYECVFLRSLIINDNKHWHYHVKTLMLCT